VAGNPKIVEYGKDTQYTSGCQAAVDNGRKGGIASVKSKSIRAKEIEEWIELLNLPMKESDLDELKSFSGVKGANLTVSKAMKAKLVTEVLKGNLKAYELLLRLIGMDEPEPQEATQEQSNGFVGALNNTAAEVWENEAPEKE
jgi:hypothetical protein